MKAYITCPITHTKERLNLLPEIERVTQSKRIDTFIFQIGGKPAEIFKRDYEQLKACNILIAEVSERSHGVGIEIGISFCLGHEIILLHQKGNYITSLAQGIPKAQIIEYEKLGDLKEKLSFALDKYGAQN
ncbi:MAG TPA: hypothetical protein HA362_03255 [Nanoarchaeota archaeon]|nr:hypothetical protein [Nanoarchaeota archaeon]